MRTTINAGENRSQLEEKRAGLWVERSRWYETCYTLIALPINQIAGVKDMGIQARVVKVMADNATQYHNPTIDMAIAHACGHRGMPVQEREYSLAHAGRDYGVILSREQDKESTRLGEEYAAEVNGWDWKAAIREAQGNAEDDRDNPGESIGRVFLGTVMSLAPSGKYYMPWCTNQTQMDEIRDAAYFEALDAAADAAGGWIENGEGDPCDVFFALHVDAPDDEESEESEVE